ncbi:MAG: transcription-repair coupling factor [Legionellaceae bacterium]|nr:transcription-repair coupling factor [Legionellaceae bacterium]
MHPFPWAIAWLPVFYLSAELVYYSPLKTGGLRVSKYVFDKWQGFSKPVWHQLYGAALPLALAEFCQQQSGIKLIITPDNLQASQLCRELLFFSEPQSEILSFPDWETLPYDQFSPHEDIISERLYALNRLQQADNLVLIASVSTLLHRLCPPAFLQQQVFSLSVQQSLHRDRFRCQLQQAGYRCVNKVLEHGEYALRGSIIDIFPMGSTRPFRIELMDNDIESLRYFDVDSQRTIDKVDTIQILPAREFPLTESAISEFRRNFRHQFTGNPAHCPIYEAVSQQNYPGGIEYYLPFFYEETATIFDFLPAESQVLLIEDVHQQADQFWQEVKKRYEQRNYDVTRPILNPEQLFIPTNDFFAKVKHYAHHRCYHRQDTTAKQAPAFPVSKAPALPIDRQSSQPLKVLSDYLQQKPQRFLLVAESAGRREVLLELLSPTGLPIKNQESWHSFLEDDSAYNILTGPLLYGAELPQAAIAIIVESQLFGEHIIVNRSSKQSRVDPDRIIRDLAELQIGAPVVHLNFGVGRYQGLTTFDNQGITNEFLILSYAGDDKIYVPVTSLQMISRYTGSDSEHAPLHRLGTEQWQKEKKKAAEKIHDVAIELLEVYAKRAAREGFSHTCDKLDYQRFSSAFPFEETPDQKRAIADIITDMQAPRPMDRLICGDVGFGKTEVAMRAAFIAVQNGKQVCVLVPTTLLAGQHFENFRDRFADFAITIELLSRFRSANDSQKVIERLAQGKVDIVIGTHKLFSRDIHFKNLGLLIIDEEHRFGVKQKEFIKRLRTEVDVLSMTATPIPRTLNMAMANLRDISLIATPPAKRLAIKTFWLEHNDTIIREAVLREVLRGGQVYFLHNNVQTINRIVQELQALLPEAKVQVGHGQMPERQLERVMSDFYHHRFNVLVCTTIIETGIDIPTANTIIIDRADKFGLAQLHQLRGRVGRSHHQAYAYLLTPNEKLLTSDAKKRLDAIVSLEDLGAGFTLATHDLEIRGAGELLGEEQSGNMHAIGFNLFMEMLDRAVTDLKAGRVPELAQPVQQGPEIDLRLSAIIPETYIQDIHNRLIMYKRIANADSQDALHDLQIELIDRFGLLPQTVKNLFLLTRLKQKAETLGIIRIQGSAQQAKIVFGAEAHINPATLIQLIQLQAKRYQMKGPQTLICALQSQEEEAKLLEIQELLDKLEN